MTGSPDAPDLLKTISTDKPMALILAGHDGSGKSTLSILVEMNDEDVSDTKPVFHFEAANAGELPDIVRDQSSSQRKRMGGNQ